MNILKNLSIVILLLIGLIATGQKKYTTYYNKTNEAEYRLLCNNIVLAKQTYTAAFRLVKKPFGKDLYMMARCYAIENKFDSAYIYLNMAANSTFPFFKRFIKQDKIWSNLFSQYPEYRNKLIEIDSLKLDKEDNDKEFKEKQKVITYYTTEDQRYRNEFTKIQNLGYDSSTTVYKESWNKMISFDEKIQKEFIKYVKHHGYPGLINGGSDIIHLILLHFSKENIKLIKPILFKGIEKGDIYPMEIANMIDRIEFSFENKCGFSFYSMEYCKESDWPEIIKRRLELGLGVYLDGYGRDVSEKREIFPWVGEIIQ